LQPFTSHDLQELFIFLFALATLFLSTHFFNHKKIGLGQGVVKKVFTFIVFLVATFTFVAIGGG
jgi:hypothetical protein